MIPLVSLEPIVGVLSNPDNIPKRPTVAYTMGGIALNNPSEGYLVQVWRAWFDRNTTSVMVESPNTPPTKIFDQDGIVWLTFCFDQTMRWSAAYTLNDGKSYLRWYNSLLQDYETTFLGEGVVSPFLTLDDKRAVMNATSDMVLAYIQNQRVIIRVQRERFENLHIWAENIPKDWIIRNFGMSNKLRLQMEIR